MQPQSGSTYVPIAIGRRLQALASTSLYDRSGSTLSGIIAAPNDGDRVARGAPDRHVRLAGRAPLIALMSGSGQPDRTAIPG
jgi:hypothetical protein